MASVKKARHKMIEWATDNIWRMAFCCTSFRLSNSESHEAQVLAIVMIFRITSCTVPLPLYCFLHWERKILISSTDPLLIIIIGSFLLQAWTGLRWADMQRVNPINLIFDFETLRGIAWRTKTTRGQAFGCISSGFLSHGSHNWLLVYLRALDGLYGRHADANLDFIVPRISGTWNQLQLVQPLEADALHGCFVLSTSGH